MSLQIGMSVLKQLMDKVHEDIGSVEEESIKTHFLNTQEHLKRVTQDI